MSEQVIVDPDRLRAFAERLNRFAARIEDLDRDMQAALARLGESFRDEHYTEFRDRFMVSRQLLTAFTADIRGVTPAMQADAEDITASQRIRLDL